MFRFFACDIDSQISKEDEHHLLNVIRIKAGESFEIVNADSSVNVFVVDTLKPFKYHLISQYFEQSSLKKEITLLFALSKGDKQEVVIQKCTELGVNHIVFVPSERSVMKISKDSVAKKLARYQSIAKEASMQSKRNMIPDVKILSSFLEIKNHISDINYVGYEKLSKNEQPNLNDILKDDIKSVSIYIGSEGGISDKEIEALNKWGFKNISLGNRILRCETAAIYALSVISYLLENEKS